MKGVRYITNDKNKKVAVQIDLKILEKHHQAIADMLDSIIAESRNDDKSIEWSAAKKKLKKAGKLK